MPFTSRSVCIAYSIMTGCALLLSKQRVEIISCFTSHQPNPNRIIHKLMLMADLKLGIRADGKYCGISFLEV